MSVRVCMPAAAQAQQRGSLHAHILVWYQRRQAAPGWEPIPPIPRTATGTEHKQRPSTQSVLDLPHIHEDSCYHHAEIMANQCLSIRMLKQGTIMSHDSVSGGSSG